MITTPNTLSTKDKKRRKQRPPRPPGSDLQHLLHEILNQLTVMNLCCFKFRAAAKQSCHPTLLVEIERMEHAVIEITSLLGKISESVKPTPVARALAIVPRQSERSAAQIATSNVYPLFRPTRRRH